MRFIKKLTLFLTIFTLIFTILTPAVAAEKNIKETDIVVVGGGGAGIVSALKASENGAQVILLEKMGYLGGATMLSAGIIPAAGTSFQKEAGIEDTPIQMAKDILRPSHYSVNKELVNMVAERSDNIVDWMEELGVEWNLLTGFLYKGQSNYRMHQAAGEGAQLTKTLISEMYNRDNIEVMLETPGTGLLTDSKQKVLGVTAENKSGEEILIKAENVILATSGFAANEKMLEKYMPEIKGAYPRVAPGATGEGIKWAQKLGADVANMSAYQGYAPISNKTKASLDLSMLYRGAILVNNRSSRFVNEHQGYSELSAHVVNQPNNIAYLIMDKNVAEGTSELEKYKEDDILFKAESPERLAEKINLNADKLTKIFSDYKKTIKNGGDRYNRTKLPTNWQPPFYAIEVTSDLRHTQGGLAINTKAQVLDTNGDPIENLYAAGGVAEGFSSSGGPAYMSGNGLLQAFAYGELAGINSAKNLKETTAEITAAENTFKDGEYKGVGEGYKGPIEVLVTIKAEKIAEIKVLSHQDTQNIADNAVEKLTTTMIKNNRADIDVVSGATNTSKGFIEAVQNALNKANK